MRAAAVVLARSAVPGRCRAGLESRLGADGCARLERVLLGRTVAWASQAVGEERVTVVTDGDPVAAAAAAAERFGTPLLVVRPDVPRLAPGHADAALLDLREGADASFGPLQSGGWYLLALRELHRDLLVVDGDGDSLLARTLAAAARLGLEVGLLRMERGLETPADADALRADPLLPAEVRAALAHP